MIKFLHTRYILIKMHWQRHKSSGKDHLASHFYRQGWLTLPRSLMQEMPDKWQKKLAVLMDEWDETWDWSKLDSLETMVSIKKNGRFVKAPEVISNYRYPDREAINNLKN